MLLIRFAAVAVFAFAVLAVGFALHTDKVCGFSVVANDAARIGNPQMIYVCKDARIKPKS